MSLRSSFFTTIWNRGQEYYRANRIQSFRAAGNHYSAVVRGTRLYNVDLYISGDRLMRASCDCPYADGDTLCKHEAAVAARVMYYLAHERKVDVKTVRPFAAAGAGTADAERSGYFDVNTACRKLAVKEEDYELAQGYCRDRTIRLTGVERCFPSYRDDPALSLTGRITEGRTSGQVHAVLIRHALYTASCGMPGCYGKNNQYYEPDSCCEHVLALLLTARERLKERPVGYGTDRTGSYLMSFFEDKSGPVETQDRRPAVRLEARLVSTPLGKLYVDFRCGVEKLYVIRDPASLFGAEERREMYETAQQKIDFSQVTFAEDCGALAAWAGKGMAMQSQILQSAVQGTNISLRKADLSRLLLAGQQLDSFFEWGVGKTLTMVGGDARKITFGEGKLRLKFRIEPQRDASGFTGVKIEGELPPLQFTDKYLYYLTDGRFLRDSSEELLPIRRVLESAGHSNHLAFTIGRNDLSTFYHTVLPVLRRCAEVEELEPAAVAPYVPMKPAIAFYLDYQDQTILMRATAAYGEQEYPLYDGDMRLRDVAAESRVVDQVAPLFTEWDPVNREFALKADEERLYRFLTEDMDLLGGLGEIHATDRFAALRVRRHWSVTAGVRLESGVLDLTLLSEELSQEELAELLGAYAARKHYHRLKDGSFIALEQTELDQLDALFEAAHVPLREFVSGHMHLPQYRALYLDRVLEEHEAIVSDRDRHYRELIKVFKTISDSDYEAPESVNRQLRPYQRAGYQWLMTLYERGFGGILADDMGLGKTLQMIAVFEYLRQAKPETVQLVICPASLVYNWIDEMRRFAPDLKALPIAGARGVREALLREEAGRQNVLVTSYDLFKRDVAEYEPLNIHVAVLDEAQFIKNQGSAAAKSVKALRCGHRFALTGTPVENSLSELWSIFDFLMPGFLYGYETFRKELETPIVKHEDARARERLRRMVAPFVLRRLKKDVLRDLPDKNEEQRRVALEGKQRKLYDAQVLKLKRLLSDATDESFRQNKLQVLAELTRLRQVCCDPSLLYGDYEDESAKREALMDLLTTAAAGGHKALVFSQFTSMLSLIEKDIQKAGLSYMTLTGETEKKERLRMANSFNTDDTNVFLISLRAGGTGLNLVGADIVIHYDPWWNYAVEQQATDRAHRIGQTRAVTVYKLIAKDTVEERIVALQDSKRDLAEGILSGDSVSLKDMSREDLMELLT